MNRWSRVALTSLIGTVLSLSAQAAPRTETRFVPVRDFEAGPSSARTQNQYTEGTATSVAFAGKNGTRLLVGYNDDRMRSFDSETGSSLWQSRSLGEDVTAVYGCANPAWAVARLVNGDVYIFFSENETDFRRWVLRDGNLNSHNWFTGITQDCNYAVADEGNKILVHDVKNKQIIAQIPIKEKVNVRGMQLVNGEVLLEGEQEFESWKVDKPSGALPVAKISVAKEKQLPAWAEAAAEKAAIEAAAKERGEKNFKAPTVKPVQGQLVQMSKVGEKNYLFEYCAEDRCSIEINNERGRTISSYTFATSGSTIDATKASTWTLSADGSMLFVYRPGMTARVVTLKSGKVDYLVTPKSALAAEAQAAFHPNGKMLALTMYPTPSRVTIFELKDVEVNGNNDNK